nr:PREDICTED: dr1-associated corepressor isoform X2 [Bemisia tabaci]
MQTDEEVGKVAQAVPVIISRTLELFVESLLTKAVQITTSRNAKTLSTSHMKQCILSETRFDFLKDLVKSLPDISISEDDGAQNETSSSSGVRRQSSSTTSEPVMVPEPIAVSSKLTSHNKPNFYREISTSEATPQPVLQPPVVSYALSSSSSSLLIDEDYDT